jgi:hypothetical protein
VSALEQLVQVAEQLSGERLFGMSAGDGDTDAEGRFDGADMRVVLAEQIGEQPGIVEMEFERVFSY